MYIVLANELADVDLAEFENVGSFRSGVIAVPTIDVCLTIKGMRSSRLDNIEDCQNTLCLTFEAYRDGLEDEDILLEDPFEAGIIYRREGCDFVELKYEHRLGLLTLYAYFLVDVNNCLFGYHEKGKTHTGLDYVFLWNEGHVRRVKS